MTRASNVQKKKKKIVSQKLIVFEDLNFYLQIFYGKQVDIKKIKK